METREDTIQVEIRLSGSVARDAEACGLLRPEHLEPWLREGIRQRSGSPAGRSERRRLVEDLLSAVLETRQYFSDIQQRQFAFAKFKKMAMDRLWEVYQECPRYDRQLALQVRMAVRKLNSIELATPHLDALTSILQKMLAGEASLADVTACKKTLLRSGIDVVARLGERTSEMLPLYDEGIEDG